MIHSTMWKSYNLNSQFFAMLGFKIYDPMWKGALVKLENLTQIDPHTFSIHKVYVL